MSVGSSFGHRGWAVGLLALSVLLLASGIAIVATDLGDPTREYYRVDVSVEDPGAPFEMSVPDDRHRPEDVFGIDCDGVFPDERMCTLEHALLQSPNSSAVVANHHSSAADFVVVGEHFYRRTTSDYNGTHDRIGLERVPASVVAANVSVPVARLSESEQDVIQRGSARLPADVRVADDLLIDTGDGYAMIAENRSERTHGWPPIEYPLLLVALVVFARGGQHVSRAREASFSDEQP